MRHLSKWCWLVLIWPCLAVDADAVVEAGPAAQLAVELGRLASMNAEFTQVTLAADGRVLQENSGRLWVASPARFRIETDAPFAQTLVSDGQDFWSFDAELEQVIIQPLDKDVEQVPILLLGGDSAAVIAAYEVSAFEDETARYFVLTPKSQATLFETLTIAFADSLPQAITISDAMGQQTRINFTAASVNQAIDPAQFRFNAPDGVDIIDDRSPE